MISFDEDKEEKLNLRKDEQMINSSSIEFTRVCLYKMYKQISKRKESDIHMSKMQLRNKNKFS